MKKLAIPASSSASSSCERQSQRYPLSRGKLKLQSVAFGWMLLQSVLLGAPAVAEIGEERVRPVVTAQATPAATKPEDKAAAEKASADKAQADKAAADKAAAEKASADKATAEQAQTDQTDKAAAEAKTDKAASEKPPTPAPAEAAAPAATPTASPAPEAATPASEAEVEAAAEQPAADEQPAAAPPTVKEPASYTQLLQDIEAKKVKLIEYDPRLSQARVTYNDRTDVDLVRVPREPSELLDSERIAESGVDLNVQSSEDSSRKLAVLGNLLIFLVIIIGVMLIIRRSAGVANQAMSFGKSRARFQMEAKTGVMFEDVAGVEEAKEELQEVVAFLKQPEKFTSIGAKIPKGMLLVGPPGTGKTLLAKAIAGEAGVPFFSMSGSEVVEMFVGVGASRVRDLFKKAKDNRPCLIFIDEIDAVGRKRGTGMGGGNDEREQTLNQLLTEMDGFEDNSGIIIIAATNRPDVLDPALLRPGRFDRQVMVDLPTRQGRQGILTVHAKSKKIEDDVSMEAIARRTPGFSGADLANLLNEAAILTARRRKEAMTMLEVEDAIDRLTIGLKLKPLLDSKKKRLLAYHEVGHALLQTLLKDADKLNKVTIIPRSGGVGGFSQAVPNEENLDSGMYSRAWLEALMIVYMGGRAAEHLVFGPDEVTPGASSDIRGVTNMARQMITQYGMSSLGQLAIEGAQGISDEDLMGRPDHSEEMRVKIDQEVRAYAMKAQDDAYRMLSEHRELIDVLVDMLIEQEVMEGDDFRAIVAKHAEIPEKRGYEDEEAPQDSRVPAMSAWSAEQFD